MVNQSHDPGALRQAVGDARAIVVFTGAGISTESGIDDFRSPGGVWSRMKPIQFADFMSDEAVRLEDWRRRFAFKAEFERAKPNAGHHAVAELKKAGKLRAVITQNIDGLHQRAGVPDDDIIEIHGTGLSASCLDCAAAMPFDAAREHIRTTGTSPRCNRCDGLVKSDVVSFGQPMPRDRLERAVQAALDCDLMIVAGSSLVVEPAASLPRVAQRQGATVAIVNREPTPLDSIATHIARTGIGDTLTHAVGAV